MQTRLAHIQLNVRPANMPFYRDLMAFVGWQPIVDGDQLLGVASTGGTSLWFVAHVKDVGNDYDGPGMNHVAIGAESQADVDAVAAYLSERKVELLFETPRHRPEFAHSPEHTYYQVMFCAPDGILVEVVYTGAKSA